MRNKLILKAGKQLSYTTRVIVEPIISMSFYTTLNIGSEYVTIEGREGQLEPSSWNNKSRKKVVNSWYYPSCQVILTLC